MRELSMHILDLAQNSIAAASDRIEILVAANTLADTLTVTLKDNGRGMPPEFLENVRDPFTTTRTTRRVGLGIPMMAESAQACGGKLAIHSQQGQGTTLTATFKLSHIDRAPLGDITSTLITLIAANPDISFKYAQSVDDKQFVFDTTDVKNQLDGVSINELPVLRWISEYVKEGIGGRMEIN